MTDLKKKGKLSPTARLNDDDDNDSSGTVYKGAVIDRLKLALMIMDTYV